MPLCSRVIPDVRDRRTDVRQHHRLMPRLGGGGIINDMNTSAESVCGTDRQEQRNYFCLAEHGGLV